MKTDNNNQKLLRKGNYVDLYVNENYSLTMKVVDADAIKDLLFEQTVDVNTDQALWLLMEDHLCNGFDWISPEEIGALTSSPIFSNSVVCDPEDNHIVECDYVWWYPQYEVYSPVEELLKHGEVTFTYQDN